MKTCKKFASVLLALVMIFTLATTAFAATVTLPGDDTILKDHSFTAYQIFAGDEADGVLSNVTWGGGIDSAAFLAALKADTTYGEKFIDCDSAAKVAEALGANNTEALAKAVAQIAYDNKTGSGTALTAGDNTLADGYYLIVDTTENVAEGSAYNAALLQVVGDVDITVKTDAPSVEKKVKDADDTAGTTTGWQDSADHDIGDDVPFQLTAALPNNVSAYDTYKLIFHDTLSKGLRYNGDAKVYVNGTETNGFEVEPSTNSETGVTTLTISCNNVKAENVGAGDGAVITVEYTAELTTDAEIGAAGNPNEVYLEYSNNPNKSGEGTTPKDIVIVFTYKTVIDKVTKNPDYDPDDPNSQEYLPLTGAAFKLEKLIKGVNGAEDAWELVKDFTVEGQENTETSFVFTGLDDGTYKLTETVTPAGYNTIDPITFTISATHTEGDAPELTGLNGEKVSGEITFTPNTADGSLSADVVNNAGTTLPETGGIGTTIFYAVGGILVLAAVVLLVTKKRMSAKD